jgi:hypothetical protein
MSVRIAQRSLLLPSEGVREARSRVPRGSQAGQVFDGEFSRRAQSPTLDPGAKRPASWQSALSGLDRHHTQLNRNLTRAARGKPFSATELLQLQQQVYQYGIRLDLCTRVCDRTLSALKTVMNIQS